MKKTNIIEINEFHKAQSITLQQLKDSLIQSFGPMGSNAMILKDNQFNKYSKDGKTILENIRFVGVVEEFCRRDIAEITRNIVTTVGDGTTSAIILSSLIFDGILNAVDENGVSLLGNYPPVTIAKALKAISNKMAEVVSKDSVKDRKSAKVIFKIFNKIGNVASEQDKKFRAKNAQNMAKADERIKNFNDAMERHNPKNKP